MRCARRNVPCPGYRDEVDVFFRNESQSTFTARANQDQRKKSRTTISVASLPCTGLQSPSDSSCSHHAPALSTREVPRPLTYSSTTNVEELPLILDSFSYSPGWQNHASSMTFLNDMVQQSAEDSALISACRAVARAYFSNRLQTIENKSNELATYGKALAATNALLRDREACSRDNTALASVWLLGLHEVCSSDSLAIVITNI